ncbi:MAG: hypothetical protein KTR31_38335 [Myxococcales bacterium]|nr:hypothetical protein [Myxococcales bacterium]
MIAPLTLLAIAACSTADPTAGTLSQNVGQAFEPCSEAEIRYLATKHNFMTAFRPCGNNHFGDFSWSLDGRQLYFQLGMGHHIMDAEAPTKDTRVVPTPSPIGPAAWVSSTRLVVPVGPDADAAAEANVPRLALYDTEQASVFTVNLPAAWTEILDLQRADDSAHVLLSALVEGTRKVYSVDLTDGTVGQPFEWLSAVDTFSYTPSQKLLVVGAGNTVTVHETEQGQAKASFTPALRGTLHPEGRWLMLEHEGDPISIFYQRAWDELSEQARERELRRAQRFEERLPDSFETEVRPPTLSFVDMTTSKRFRIDSVYGSDFEWYEPTPFYGSFRLWGFEGKQFKRNVLLGNFTDRMTAAAAGATFIGVEPFEPEAAAP